MTEERFCFGPVASVCERFEVCDTLGEAHRPVIRRVLVVGEHCGGPFGQPGGCDTCDDSVNLCCESSC